MVKEDSCPYCGSRTWVDDDAHWWWCSNPKCSESWSNQRKSRDYEEELYYLKKLREDYEES